jgi:hypothetical protein
MVAAVAAADEIDDTDEPCKRRENRGNGSVLSQHIWRFK